MRKRINAANTPLQQPEKDGGNNFQENSLNYPANEDIYYKSKKEADINPENISKMKDLNEKDIAGTRNEKDFNDDVSGSDLDVPGAELDDQQEIIGSEDEENNYYSIGGDNHNNLEEDKRE